MKTQTLKTLITVGFLATCTPALAGFLNSTKLVQLLEEDARGAATYDVGVVTGYVIGVIDVANGVLACPPNDASIKQVKQIVINYMKAHPEQWNNSADSSVVAALRSTWPCSKK